METGLIVLLIILVLGIGLVLIDNKKKDKEIKELKYNRDRLREINHNLLSDHIEP